jgi:hypothetical protein
MGVGYVLCPVILILEVNMQHNADQSVTFELGDWVGDTTTGTERFGEVIDVKGGVLTVSPDSTGDKKWDVLEKECYPG